MGKEKVKKEFLITPREMIMKAIRKELAADKLAFIKWMVAEYNKELEPGEPKITITEMADLQGVEINECGHGCKDCDNREVVGDEEHCLAGEEMK